MRNVLLSVLSLALLATPAAAGIDIDFGAAITIGDDTDLYLGVSSRYFDRDRDEVDRWHREYRDPDDLSVALFLARHSGRSLAEIHAVRHGGATWWEVSLRFGVRPDVWFVPVAQSPGPPYGKAYGYWKKHGRRSQAYALSDADLRNLVAVRMIHEYYGVPVSTAMELRARGKQLRAIVGDEYRKRHAAKSHARSNAKAGPSPAARGKSRGNGKSKRDK